MIAIEQTIPKPRQPRNSDWLIIGSLLLLSLVPALAGTARLVQLAGGAEVTAHNARFFMQPLPVVVHIISVSLYSMLGAFQFAPSFRRHRAAWHRKAGRVLWACGMLAVLSGLWMTHYYPWPAMDGILLYWQRIFFGGVMLVSLVLAILSARKRDFRTHGAWMIRAYAIGMGAGTQVLTHLPWVLFPEIQGELSRAIMMGAGWMINWLVAEVIILRMESKVVAHA